MLIRIPVLRNDYYRQYHSLNGLLISFGDVIRGSSVVGGLGTFPLNPDFEFCTDVP